MSGAGAALQAAIAEALTDIEGLACFPGPPVQAAAPYALVETGSESDWSHKSGKGRELRVAVTLYDRGESPVRLRVMMEQAETAAAGIGAAMAGWRLVALQFLRSRLVAPSKASPSGLWAGVIEFRARMIAE